MPALACERKLLHRIRMVLDKSVKGIDKKTEREICLARINALRIPTDDSSVGQKPLKKE
jgi:hypothetical protein